MLSIEETTSHNYCTDSLGSAAMTSNPSFEAYVESVQENLAVLSLTNEAAKRYLMESKPLARYNPRFIAFEILFNDQRLSEDESNESVQGNSCLPRDFKFPVERKFDPHVSDTLFEDADLYTCWKDLIRLYKNAKHLRLDLKTVDWSVPKHIEQDEYLSDRTKKGIQNLHREVLKLDDLYKRLKNRSERKIRNLSQLYEERLEASGGVQDNISYDDINPTERELIEQLIRVKETLGYLLQRYEVQYIPTNIGSTALIYEAWKQGKLIPFGNPETDEDKFRNLLSAFFINDSGKDYKLLMREIAERLELNAPRVRDIDESKLSNGRKWLGRPKNWEWFTCIESSLVHKFILEEPEEKQSYRYLIYYPLLIDDYWFAGVAFIYSSLNVDPSQGSIPEVFNRQKYAKIYNTIKSVSDTLKISLREEAIKQAAKKLRQGKNKEEVFLEAVRDYFVCFNVRKTGEKNDSNLPGAIEIYSGHGIRIFGPSWIKKLPKKQKLIKEEIEGYNAGVRHVSGLHKVIEDLAKDIRKEEEKGIDIQSQKFSHQAAGVMQMVWSDPVVRQLSIRPRAGIWHLNTLTQVWGTTEIHANEPIHSNDFPEWREKSPTEIMEYATELSLDHALERASAQTPGAPRFDPVFRQASKMLGSANYISEFKEFLGLSWKLPLRWPDWAISRGFILCFHHAFWQAAYHGFRAACEKKPSLSEESRIYLKVNVKSNRVEIINASDSSFVEEESPRDVAFFEDISQRLKVFKIKGPIKSKKGYWITTIQRCPEKSR